MSIDLWNLHFVCCLSAQVKKDQLSLALPQACAKSYSVVLRRMSLISPSSFLMPARILDRRSYAVPAVSHTSQKAWWAARAGVAGQELATARWWPLVEEVESRCANAETFSG
jgi:hypothetical protein